MTCGVIREKQNFGVSKTSIREIEMVVVVCVCKRGGGGH